MSKKVVVFDIDGTLVDDEKDLPSSTKEAIFKLQNNGVYVVIATGRPPFLFEELRKELEIKSYISFNGQHVVFEGKTIYENPINKQNITSLYEASKQYDFPMVFMNEVQMIASTDDHPFISQCFQQLTSEYPKVDESFHLHTPIHQALIFCQKGEEEQLVKQFPVFHFLRWHKFSCDILPLGGSKAAGIRKLMEASGFSDVHTFAFGDGLNDIEMLREMGTGIAMGNAVAELKEVADFVTTDVKQDGILRGLERFNLL